MSNYSLIKCAAALAVISLYAWLFGFAGEVAGETALEPSFADESMDYNPTVSDVINENTAPPAVTQRIITDEPVIKYETTIDASNLPKPNYSDYPAQTTAPAYSGDDADINSSTEEITSETTTVPTTATAPETTTTSATTTTAAPTEATTTTPSATTTTTPAPTSEISEDETSEESSGDNSLSEDSEPTEEQTTASVSNAASGTAAAELLRVSIADGTVVENTALNIISRMVQNEIGSSFHAEAIKAQVIASYTYVKLYNSNGKPGNNVRLADQASERVLKYTREMLGQAIYYDGTYAQSLYCASTAGYTASAQNVYGTGYPYLVSRETPLDALFDPNYGIKKTFSSSDVMAKVLSETGITLDGNPGEWFEILSMNDSVYVGNMRIGDRTTYVDGGGTERAFSGRYFRENIMDYDIRSSAFDISYDSVSDTFTFTTYGYGHGVGMSQNGANMLANHEGYDYKQILEFYYPGTTIKRAE